MRVHKKSGKTCIVLSQIRQAKIEKGKCYSLEKRLQWPKEVNRNSCDHTPQTHRPVSGKTCIRISSCQVYWSGETFQSMHKRSRVA